MRNTEILRKIHKNIPQLYFFNYFTMNENYFSFFFFDLSTCNIIMFFLNYKEENINACFERIELK